MAQSRLVYTAEDRRPTTHASITEAGAANQGGGELDDGERIADPGKIERRLDGLLEAPAILLKWPRNDGDAAAAASSAPAGDLALQRLDAAQLVGDLFEIVVGVREDVRLDPLVHQPVVPGDELVKEVEERGAEHLELGT